MKTFAWPARASFYVLLATSLSCGESTESPDSAVAPDGVSSNPQPDASPPQADVGLDMADEPRGDGGGAAETVSDGASIVDGSKDAEDGGMRVCWYEKAYTGTTLPSFSFTLTAPDRVNYSCDYNPRRDAGPSWPRDLRGVVTSVSATQFTLDTCVAQDACDPSVYTFGVNGARGLELTIPVGRRVRVQWQIAVPWGCISWLQVSDDTSGPSGTLWFVGDDGYQEPPFDLPFDVNLDQLGCRLPADAQLASCSGAATGDYAFRFSSKAGPAAPLSLGTMESGSFTFRDAADVAQTLDIHCLEAFQTVLCDDYWHWNFWAVNKAAASTPLDAAVDF